VSLYEVRLDVHVHHGDDDGDDAFKLGLWPQLLPLVLFDPQQLHLLLCYP